MRSTFSNGCSRRKFRLDELPPQPRQELERVDELSPLRPAVDLVSGGDAEIDRALDRVGLGSKGEPGGGPDHPGDEAGRIVEDPGRQGQPAGGGEPVGR